MKKLLVFFITLFVGWMLAGAAAAQQPGGNDLQQKVAAIKQSAAENQAALRQYQWIETTQVFMKGELKSTTRKTCYYGNDGKAVKVPMDPAQPQEQEQGARGRRPRIKEKVIENKKEELSEYMQKAVALVHEYVPPSPDKMQNALQAGNVSINPSATPGMTSVVFKNYHVQGDSMTFSINQADKKMAHLSVNTYLEDPEDKVTMKVSFADLADGTSYPGQTVLDVAAKKLQVTVSNSNYKKPGE